MSRRGRQRRESVHHGVLLVDKPAGPTSHDVVQWARRCFGTSRVGHTGTLDPFATGLLPLAIGAGTALVPFLTDADKSYLATMVLGIETSTGDTEGEPVDGDAEAARRLDVEQISEVLRGFVGQNEQIPPKHSAIKVDGRRLYEYARAGEAVEIPVRQVELLSVELVHWSAPKAVVRVHCGKGFYVRALARDVGRRLLVGGHLVDLRRETIGRLSVADAVNADVLRDTLDVEALFGRLWGPMRALSHLPVVALDGERATRVQHGQKLSVLDDAFGGLAPEEVGPICAAGPDGELVAIMGREGTGWRVLRGYRPG